MEEPWPFAEAQDEMVITLGRILDGTAPVRLVTHDADDGAWQFLDGEHVFEADAVVILLGEMAQFDPGLMVLADLPPGWYAWRPAPDQPWRRSAGEPPMELPPRDEP